MHSFPGVLITQPVTLLFRLAFIQSPKATYYDGHLIDNNTTMRRFASKKAGSSTRNKCKSTPGKKRGIKVYDGQRIPAGYSFTYFILLS